MSTSQRSRRDEYSDTTRQALVDSARDLFAGRGYTLTSLDDVVAAARVTKGALYHHFAGKAALFEAVWLQMEEEVVTRIERTINDQTEPAAMVEAGLEAFLDVCTDPVYRRIALQEAPVALGYERWREFEEQHTLGMIRAVTAVQVSTGHLPPLPVEMLSRVFFGALAGSAMAIASAEDPQRARVEVGQVMRTIVAGMRMQAPASAAPVPPTSAPAI